MNVEIILTKNHHIKKEEDCKSQNILHFEILKIL